MNIPTTEEKSMHVMSMYVHTKIIYMSLSKSLTDIWAAFKIVTASLEVRGAFKIVAASIEVKS